MLGDPPVGHPPQVDADQRDGAEAAVDAVGDDELAVADHSDALVAERLRRVAVSARAPSTLSGATVLCWM